MFRILGTPTEKDWPGIDTFKNYDTMLVPVHEKRPLKEIFPNLYLDEEGIDLLQRMLIYDPSQRITAKSALKHPFFYEILNE